MERCQCAAFVLVSYRTDAGMQLYLRPEQPAAGGFSSNARRLLAASCQLLAAAPLQVQPELQIGQPQLASLFHNLARLLGKAAAFMSNQVGAAS